MVRVPVRDISAVTREEARTLQAAVDKEVQRQTQSADCRIEPWQEKSP